MTRHLHIHLLTLLLLSLITHDARAQTTTTSPPTTTSESLDEDERKALQQLLDTQPDSPFSWRVGLGFHALRNSRQGRPLLYPDIGMRYASDRIFIAIQAPGGFAGFDILFRETRKRLLNQSDPKSALETFNDTPQFVQAEVASLRIGQLWDVRLGRDLKRGREGLALELIAGLTGVADWAVLDARLLGEPLDEDASIGSIIVTDPIILGLGLFGAARKQVNNFTAELSLTLARDMFQWEEYSRINGFIISPEVDLQVQLIKNLGVYTRGRMAHYTHVNNPRAFSFQSQIGVVLTF